MNRLQKKCFLAATGFHLLLLVILFVGPAFLSSRDKPDDSPVLTFIPIITTDAKVSGGGNPHATPPPPAPQPQPAPQVTSPAPAPPQPQPVKPIVRPPEPSLEPVERKPHKPEVSLKQVTRRQTTTAKSTSSDTDTDADTNARASAKRRQAFSSALRNLREGLASSTMVEIYGPGGGGPTYAGYDMEVQRIYKQRYDAVLGAAGDLADEHRAVVEAAVTIASDGAVRSARIVTASKNTALNRLIQQQVLDNVTILRPFPEGAKDSERTVKIVFDLKPKTGAG